MQTAADGKGNFRFANLQSGYYELAPSHSGFLAPPAHSGLFTEWYSVASGQDVSGKVLELDPASAVTGKVLDADGQPVQNAGVTVIRPTYTVPQQPSYPRFSGTVQTDDRGIYWAAGLPAGTYGLKINPPPELSRLTDPAGLAYPATYFPDSADPAAMATFVVGIGATRTVDVRLRKLPVFRISGRVIGPDGLGRSAGTLQLFRENGELETRLGALTPPGFDGSFEISGVPAGSYLLMTRLAGDGQTVFARQPITVAGDMDGVRVQCKFAHEIRGRVRIDGEAAGDISGISIQLCPLNNAYTVGSAPLNPDLSFSFANAMVGRYTICVNHLPAAYYVKSVLYDGKEVPATGLDAATGSTLTVVVSAAGAAKLDGRVLDASGKPAPHALVTLFPTDGCAMSTLSGHTDAGGDFALPTVRPGQYRVLAWEDSSLALRLQSAGLGPLQPLDAKSLVVQLRSGGRETVELHWVSTEEKQRVFAAR